MPQARIIPGPFKPLRKERKIIRRRRDKPLIMDQTPIRSIRMIFRGVISVNFGGPLFEISQNGPTAAGANGSLLALKERNVFHFFPWPSRRSKKN